MSPDLHESITLSTRLVHVGEPITLRLTSVQEYVPLTLEVTAGYLENPFAVGDGLRVTWDVTGAIKQGTATFTPEEPGSYVIRFGAFHRSFAVIDDTYAICLLTIPFATGRYPKGNQLDLYHPDVHGRHLPVNYTVMVTDKRSLDPEWAVHKTLRAFQLIYDDAVMPFIDDLAATEAWQDAADGAAESCWEALFRRWAALGYTGPEVVGVHTPDGIFISEVRRREIVGLVGLNARRLRDGARQGSADPATAEGDLFTVQRHTDQPPTDAVLGIPWLGGTARTAPLLCPRLYLEDGRIIAGDPAAFYADLDKAIADKRVFTVVLDGDAFDVVELNRTTITRLLDLPRQHKLVFSRAQDVLRYVRRRAASERKEA